MLTKRLHSKFSNKYVIVEPIVVILVVCFLCAIVTFASLNMTKDGTPLYRTPIWGILLFVLMLIWTIRYYLKTFKRYIFLDKGFEVRNIFGKEFHSWKTVKDISLIENSYEKILWQYLKGDALSIHLKNGKILELFSKYYENMPAIRHYLNSMTELNLVNTYSINNDESIKPLPKRKYRGSFIFSFNGFLGIFLLLLSIIMLWHSWSSITLAGFIFLLGIPISIFLIFGFQSYYFQLDQKYLIVKNHIFLNVKHQFNLEQIRVIYFEQKFKKEPSVRIIKDDYSVISFQGGSLNDRQWMSLILILKNKGITIVDELFYEYNE